MKAVKKYPQSNPLGCKMIAICLFPIPARNTLLKVPLLAVSDFKPKRGYLNHAGWTLYDDYMTKKNNKSRFQEYLAIGYFTVAHNGLAPN